MKRTCSCRSWSRSGRGRTYENECLIFDVNAFKRYTQIDNDNGSTTILFEITLKTVGQFGFHAS